MPPAIIAALVVVIFLLLSTVIFPALNKKQFEKMPFEQQVRILMKQATGLSYFKNISGGSSGTLYYVKNKRKIYSYPWVMKDGKMVCTRSDLFEKWDYPEDALPFSDEERELAIKELEIFNKKNFVKFYLDLD